MSPCLLVVVPVMERDDDPICSRVGEVRVSHSHHYLRLRLPLHDLSETIAGEPKDVERAEVAIVELLAFAPNVQDVELVRARGL